MSTNTVLASAPLTTTGFHIKATGTTLGNSLIWDNGTNVGIGNTNTSYTLDVSGTGRFTGALRVDHSTAAAYAAVIYNTSATGQGLTIRGGSTASHSALVVQPYDGSSTLLNILSTGAATFSSSLTAASGTFTQSAGNSLQVYQTTATNSTTAIIRQTGSGGNGGQDIGLLVDIQGANDLDNIANFRYYNGSTYTSRFSVKRNGAIITNGPYIGLDGSGVNSPSGFGYGLFPYAGVGLGLYSTAGSIGFWTSGTPVERLRITTTSTNPVSDNAYTLGASGIRWSSVWAANGTIQTSDEREKKDIVECDLGLDFISKLRPVSFKWKVGKNEISSEIIIDENGKEQYKQIVTPIEGKRIHYGLIAQEVEELLNGKDFGGFIHDKETDIKGLRYDQFIPLLIKAMQEQQVQIEELKALIAAK